MGCWSRRKRLILALLGHLSKSLIRMSSRGLMCLDLQFMNLLWNFREYTKLILSNLRHSSRHTTD